MMRKEFINQTIYIPVSHFESSLLGTSSDYFFRTIEIPQDEMSQMFLNVSYYILRYIIIFYMTIYCMRMYDYLFRSERCEIIEEMETMLNEISDMSRETRRKMGENYYILTNVLVNRFRIHVYEKILK